MSDEQVRALQESDALLRRVANLVRQLGSDDHREPLIDENGARTQPSLSREALATIPAPTPIHIASADRATGSDAACLGALRRCREVLDVLDRHLRARVSTEETCPPVTAG